MKKGAFSEKNVERNGPEDSILYGEMANGKTHAFVIGNEQGKILPKFLMTKFITIESGVVYGRPMATTLDDEQRDRFLAMMNDWDVFCDGDDAKRDSTAM